MIDSSKFYPAIRNFAIYGNCFHCVGSFKPLTVTTQEALSKRVETMNKATTVVLIQNFDLQNYVA